MRKNGKFIQCIQCKEYFYVNKYQIDKRKYCSQKCSAIANIGHHPPKTAFKKGHISWNKGKHIYLGGKRFEKGHIPWIKGKHPEYMQGKNHWNWKGGKRNKGGYVFIYKPNHPHTIGGYIFEHRFIMEQIIGRYLKSCELVHHINGIKNDNRPENLKLFLNKAKHTKFHKLSISMSR